MEEKLHLTTASDCVATKGPVLDWTNDGKLHESFLEWKKKVSVLCKGLKMTKADPEFICLCIYQWSGDRGQNILYKTTFPQGNLKKGKSTSRSWRSNASQGPWGATPIKKRGGMLVGNFKSNP